MEGRRLTNRATQLPPRLLNLHTVMDSKETTSPSRCSYYSQHGRQHEPQICSRSPVPKPREGDVEPSGVNSTHTESISQLRNLQSYKGTDGKPPPTQPSCRRGRRYLHYIGQETKLTSDPERDLSASFQRCLLYANKKQKLS